MFGFLKKSKKDKQEGSEKSKPAESGQKTDEKKAPKKKKKSRIKFILILFLILAAVGGAAFTVYTLYFSNAGNQGAQYKKMDLPHVQLPEEMMKFSFEHFPDLYKALVLYNQQINLLDAEITRIEGIGQQYPDQIKIAQKEKQAWEKTKTAVEKAFLKIKNPVKETYVLYQVNREEGMARITELNNELTAAANEALLPVQTLTQKLTSQENIPQGMVQGTIYKLKKKFL